MAMIDPSPLVTNTKPPKFEFIDGHLYCDGVKVAPWQTTQEEIQRYVPKKFQETFFKAKNKGVIPNAPQKAG